MRQMLKLAVAFSILASGCGGGGGGSDSGSPTGTTPPAPAPSPAPAPAGVQSTQLSFDSTLSEATRQAVSEVLSPSGAALPDASLVAPTSTTSGQSLAVAVNPAGEIMLAAVVTSAATTLSADSTALAFARLLSARPASPSAATQLDSKIRASAAYLPLVDAIRGQLGTGTPPLRSAQVRNQLLALVEEVAVASATGSTLGNSPRASILRADPAVIDPFPFTLIQDFAKTPKSIKLAGDSLCAPITNPMPIPWSVSVSRGAPIRSILLAATSTQCIEGDPTGFDLILEQTPKTRAAAQIKVFSEILSQALTYYIGGDKCIQKTSTAITEVTLDVAGDGTYDGFGSELQSFATISKALELAGCVSADVAKIVAKISSITKPLADLATLDSSVDTLVTAVYLKRYFEQEPKSYGVCVSENKIVNCAAEYRVTPSTLYMAPRTSVTPLVEAFDDRGVRTGLPSGLIFVSQDSSIASIDPTTGKITANAISSSPIQLSVEDKWAGKQGKIAVHVVMPQISPRTGELAPGPLTLTLKDATGNKVLVPPGVLWTTTEDPGGPRLTFGTSPVGDTATWIVPKGAAPGFVTVTAFDGEGNSYDTALFQLTGGRTFKYVSGPLQPGGFKGDVPVPVPGPVTATVTFKAAVSSTFSGTRGVDQIERLVLESSGIGTIDLPPTSLYSVRLDFQNGKPAVWTISSGLVEIGTQCVAREATTGFPTVFGKLYIAIATGNDFANSGTQVNDTAFDRCVGTDSIGRTFTNFFTHGYTSSDSANWVLVSP